jgi:16S rRNA processing protein RimM
VRRPHGVRGELRVELLTGYPERLSHHEVLYLGPDLRPYRLESVRLHKDLALVKLVGCEDRDQADLLRGQLVQVPFEDAVPLEEGEYYHFQVIGAEVVTEAGETLGQVAEVLETRANDVYVVLGPRGEVLIPAVEHVVQEIDLEAGRIVVRLLPGLLADG